MIEKTWTEFLQYGKNWFYLSPEKSWHRIVKVFVIANGTRDLCIVKEEKPGQKNIEEIAKAKKEDIVHIPSGDILWIVIFPPYKDGKAMIIDMCGDKEMKKLVVAMMKSLGANPSDRGDQYDAHLGGKYWDES